MKWRSRKVYLAGAVLLLVLAILIVSNLGRDREGTTVQADLVRQDDIDEVVTASGRVQPQTKVDITAEVSAEIVAVGVREGERVPRGHLLIQLDTMQLRSDVAQARFSLEEISARADGAASEFEREKLEFERQSRLFEQKLTSETAFTNARLAMEGARANLQAMRAQVNTARARLEKAVDNLAKTKIRAPASGVITFLNAEVGEIAQAQTSFTQGKTLMTLADLSAFELDIDVDETEVAKVRLGQEARIQVDAFADTTFGGTVVEVGNSALVKGEGTENYTTSFRVQIRFAETEFQLRPGMSATADITTATARDVLLLPYAALVTREFDPDSLAARGAADQAAGPLGVGEALASEPDTVRPQEGGRQSQRSKKIKKRGVFLCRDGKAHFVEVETGIADERNIVARTGVAAGDTVISGSFQTLRKLADGERVRIDKRSLESMREPKG